jgi:hypothetical protein
VPVFCPPETCVVSSSADYTHYLDFLHKGARFGRFFQKSKMRVTHVFAAVDKFTKWVKTKPAASITAAKAVEFGKDIMYRFGLPNTIITDNGTLFTMRVSRTFV